MRASVRQNERRYRQALAAARRIQGNESATTPPDASTDAPTAPLYWSESGLSSSTATPNNPSGTAQLGIERRVRIVSGV